MDVPEEAVERLALLFANHAHNFLAGDKPLSAGFSWGEFSARERRLATQFARDALAEILGKILEKC